MARTLNDPDLRTWEVYSSSGKSGFSEEAKIIFNCLSVPDLRARYVVYAGDGADAAEAIQDMPEDHLLKLFQESVEVD
ncbi:MAG TPA: hypothetical protein VFI91_05470 [Longimicrobiaceae bacterium]|nr:hypothetical protein [Longimicrobiaceae bacterium]